MLRVRVVSQKWFRYISHSAKKVGAEGELVEYGYDSRVGDVIGVLLEYKSEVASLSFYRNGVIKIALFYVI